MEGPTASLRIQDVLAKDRLDEEIGYFRYVEGPPKLGWLTNMHETLIPDTQYSGGRSAIDLYFIEEDGSTFKSTILFEPYFFVMCKNGKVHDVEEFLRKKYGKNILATSVCEKEDLKGLNHLSGIKQDFLRVSFINTSEMATVRSALLRFVQRSKNILSNDSVAFDDFISLMEKNCDDSTRRGKSIEVESDILDLREHDISLYVRCAIDYDIRVGLWYEVRALQGRITLSRRDNILRRAEPVIMAFDIETTKLPLKFPDSSVDQIMMISYMIDGQGYLITNREIVSEDIDDFEYTPKAEFEGPFKIFNEADELKLLLKFFEHIKQTRPTVIVTYNGDFFDWPFIDDRAKFHGLDMNKMIGFSKKSNDGYLSYHASHLDCFCWVKRDSYLPQGSQGLKAVTIAKLGYNPIEIDPEDMTRFAFEAPQKLAQYSVSDAVATYYLYMKYVHPFIFSLCNIIPMNPDEVLRRGSGTLCETLLMVEAFKANVIMPNKHSENGEKYYNGHLLDSETYVGGHVEALQAGVFRSDIPTDFVLVESALDKLIDQVDHALKFSIEVEGRLTMDQVLNYEEVKSQIIGQLQALKEKTCAKMNPLIYHLDVSAMYPNIILTNRLQPDAIVDDSHCAACDFNEGPDSSCQRKLEWLWRAEYFKADKGDISSIKDQLSVERFSGSHQSLKDRSFNELGSSEQISILKSRVSEYSRNFYSKVHEKNTIERQSIVCQRENPFYIDTVRNFRDRRYEYKAFHKNWKKNLEKSIEQGNLIDAEEARKMIILYDSLQLAHKCILNSFYGYVMRKGARWYSMEMAGIVCYTGSKIIQLARQIVEQVGKPLELDTDGIWCILPKGFPENFKLKLSDQKFFQISYPCIMLNHLVHAEFTNHQYQDRVNDNEFSVRSENSIFFEVDGPYKAMILPSSTEEDKLLKKRYAVFDHDDKLTELKGFELKRRGELKLIKSFQSEIFSQFLLGNTLEECYSSVASVANRWLDLLFSKGAELADEELFDLISENRSMSKSLEEYGKQKSTSICTAKRLSEVLGDQMVKAKGLNCRFIISEKPVGSPVSERAVPVVIFQTDENVKRHYLRKWLKDNSLQSYDIRDIIDWNYYFERFGSVIQKLITIPAAMQGVENPVPRIAHPDWLQKRLSEKSAKYKQSSILKFSSKSMPLTTPFESIQAKESSESNSIPLEIEKCFVEMSSIEEILEPVEVDNGLIFTDYKSWLSSQKKTWQNIQPLKSKEKSTNLTGFLRRENQALKNADWHLLGIYETDIPGEFKIFFVVNNQMSSFKLLMHREFFMNSSKEIDESLFESIENLVAKRAKRNLPSNADADYLYHLQLPEFIYQKNSYLIQNLRNNREVKGIYELEVPLLFKTIRDLGSLVKLKNKSKSANESLLVDDFSIQDSNSYLKNISLTPIHLYYSYQDKRHFLSIFLYSRSTLLCFFSDPSGSKDNLPNVQKIYEDYIVENEIATADGDFVDFPEKIQAELSVFSQETEMLKVVNKRIREFVQNDNIILVQSMRPLSRQIPALKDYPTMSMKSSRPDNLFPALLWQSFALKKFLTHAFTVNKVLSERLLISRYSDIPICNITDDFAVPLIDIFFARRVIKTESVLSMDNRTNLMSEIHEVSHTDAPLIVNHSGFYNQICLEVEIKNLALNAIIQYSQLDGSTTGSKSSDFFNVGHSSKESLFNTSPVYFEAIKALIKTWWMQYKDTNHRLPELMLDHFHRWISQSSFNGPKLRNFIDQIMNQVFVQLVSEFRKMGSKIIYANHGKLIIMTTKTDIKKGLGYAAYVIGSIQKKPIFQYLDLTISHAWKFLCWLDRSNYGGYHVDPESGITEQFSRWNIGEYLPNKMNSGLSAILYSFFEKFDHINEKLKSSGIQEEFKEKFTHEIDFYIRNDLKKNLFKLIPSLFRQWQKNQQLNFEESDPDFRMPQLPGNLDASQNPILSLIKYMMKILSLNENLKESIRSLRKDLLNLIGVREFAEEAVFSNPSAELIVPLICTVCSHASDINLVDFEHIESEELFVPCCSSCGTDYDMPEIESKLMKKISNSLLDWQIQDLTCSKCKLIAEFNCKLECSACSNTLNTEYLLSEREKDIKLYNEVAGFYKMDLLKDYTDWILQNEERLLSAK